MEHKSWVFCQIDVQEFHLKDEMRFWVRGGEHIEPNQMIIAYFGWDETPSFVIEVLADNATLNSSMFDPSILRHSRSEEWQS